MGPKVEAACRFAEATGRTAGSVDWPTRLAVLAGRAGTEVVAGLSRVASGDARRRAGKIMPVTTRARRAPAAGAPMATDADWASYDRAVVDVARRVGRVPHRARPGRRRPTTGRSGPCRAGGGGDGVGP